MPTDDYSAVVSGGLKIKGVNVSSKISKHKKKKPKPENDSAAAERSKEGAGGGATTQKGDTSLIVSDATRKNEDGGDDDRQEDVIREKEEALALSREGKTEAELRHEERRRKRLDERLKREGTKTHKERVEELNRYLSNLSEHHDMPRIGPG